VGASSSGRALFQGSLRWSQRYQKKPYIPTKEPYIPTKEPHISVKRPCPPQLGPPHWGAHFLRAHFVGPKKALHSHKKALHSYKRALHSRKRAINFRQKALYSATWACSSGCALFKGSLHWSQRYQKSPTFPQKSPTFPQKSHIFPLKSPVLRNVGLLIGGRIFKGLTWLVAKVPKRVLHSCTRALHFHKNATYFR